MSGLKNLQLTQKLGFLGSRVVQTLGVGGFKDVQTLGVCGFRDVLDFMEQTLIKVKYLIDLFITYL